MRGNEENALKALEMVKKMKALSSSSRSQQFQVYDKDFQKDFYNFCCMMHERMPAAVAVTFPHSVIPVRVSTATSVGGRDYKENEILSSLTIGHPSPDMMLKTRGRSQSPPTVASSGGSGTGDGIENEGDMSAEPPAKRRRRSGSSKSNPQEKLRSRYGRQIVSEALKVMSPGSIRKSWGSFELLKVGDVRSRLVNSFFFPLPADQRHTHTHTHTHTNT